MNRSPRGLGVVVVDAWSDLRMSFGPNYRRGKVVGPGAKGRMLIPFRCQRCSNLWVFLMNKPVQGCVYLLVIKGRAEVGVGGFADGIHWRTNSTLRHPWLSDLNFEQERNRNIDKKSNVGHISIYRLNISKADMNRCTGFRPMNVAHTSCIIQFSLCRAGNMSCDSNIAEDYTT